MMYMCKPIAKENIVSMYDERVSELEALLEASDARFVEANNQLTREVSKYCRLEDKYRDDTNMLSSVLYYIVDNFGIEKDNLNDAIRSASYDASRVRDTLVYHEAVPENLLTCEYEVTVTVPVSVTLTVTAANCDDAEEMARDEVDCNGIDNYSMDYDLHYCGEFIVEEM